MSSAVAVRASGSHAGHSSRSSASRAPKIIQDRNNPNNRYTMGRFLGKQGEETRQRHQHTHLFPAPAHPYRFVCGSSPRIGADVAVYQPRDPPVNLPMPLG